MAKPIKFEVIKKLADVRFKYKDLGRQYFLTSGFSSQKPNQKLNSMKKQSKRVTNLKYICNQRVSV